MIIGAPRSGTTWASEWLTDKGRICLHDPLNYVHYTELDTIKPDVYGAKEIGISDTGVYFFHKWLNNHPAKKVILHRDEGEMRVSLSKKNLMLKFSRPSLLKRIQGLHVKWTDLFESPYHIYEYLFDDHMDIIRHDRLKKLNIQVNSYDDSDFNKQRKEASSIRIANEIRDILDRTVSDNG